MKQSVKERDDFDGLTGLAELVERGGKYVLGRELTHSSFFAVRLLGGM